MELKLSFRNVRELRHIPSLMKLKERFQNPTPINALEQATLNTITSRLEDLLKNQAELWEEKAAKKKANEATLNVKDKESKKNS